MIGKVYILQDGIFKIQLLPVTQLLMIGLIGQLKPFIGFCKGILLVQISMV